jgi:predicted flap endonuclease-1-like 5' DNA nuclease
MISLLSFCDIQLWHIILSWLLPFLLGLLLGWLLWGIFKRRYKKTVNERDDYEEATYNLEAKLDECLKSKKDQQDVIDILRKQLKDSETSISAKPGASRSFAFGIPDSSFEKLDADNLQIIEGVGPKMSEFLHGKGIDNWASLSQHDEKYLKSLLDSEGGKYRIIEPGTWPKQAAFAAEGKWEELIAFQKTLSGGKSEKGKDNDSKVEKILIRMGLLKKYKKDDLKAIEGIGPKIEKLFHDAGITTWKKLADSKVEDLQNILAKGGSKFQLADPGTWAQQASLAEEGKWSELTQLQDELKGGRKT